MVVFEIQVESDAQQFQEISRLLKTSLADKFSAVQLDYSYHCFDISHYIPSMSLFAFAFVSSSLT